VWCGGLLWLVVSAVVYRCDLMCRFIKLNNSGTWRATLQTSHSHLLLLLIFLFEHIVHCLKGLAFTRFGGTGVYTVESGPSELPEV